MMHELSYEDPSTERITDKKISLTFRELSRNPNKGRIVVFEKAKTIIGYAILIPYWSNEYGGNILHIDELYVKPEHRARGIATSFLERILLAKQAVALQLEVTPTNTTARNYYRNLGFKKSKNHHLIRII
jgi:ribosomal protein S18 acetylase RimI-like enzyme